MSQDNSSKHILLSGSSGMIGSALRQALTADGYRVHPLRRLKGSAPSGQGFFYDELEKSVTLDSEIPLHAVINLAGPSIADKRWNPERKRLIKQSRVDLTRALSSAIASATTKPEVLLSASAIGYYGANTDGTAFEDSASGDDFLAEVGREWEAATQPAQDAGIRTVLMRLGIVLSSRGGVVGNLVLPLRSAVVGRVGSGEQLYSWISLLDVVAFVRAALLEAQYAGPINLVAKAPTSADQLSRSIAACLHRLRLPPLPAGVVRLMFGEMADSLLLASADVRSQRLAESGYALRYPELDEAVQTLFEQRA